MNKGKILKIKSGYNPNSSSIGSHIPMFFILAASAGVVATILVNYIRKFDKKIKEKKEDFKDQN